MSLDRYLAGEDDQLEKAIVECLPLVDNLVINVVRKMPHLAYLQDDLTSAGYAHLVTAIPKLRGHDIRDGRAYLTRSLSNAAIDFARQETGVKISRREWRRLAKQGDPILPLPLEEADFHFDERPALELREAIYDCCHSAEERMIVDMRERGLTYRQIADEMNVSTGQVHNYLNAVSARLQKEFDS